MKKIIIIGGGIAGLSAGIHGQQHGFETEIHEMHSIVGGQCTGWDRKGFHIDGCIHWLTGTKEGTELYGLWKNVGALGEVKIIQQESFGTYEVGDITITLWKDLGRLQRELTELAPEDKATIEGMFREIRALQSMNTPAKMPTGMMPMKDSLKQITGSLKLTLALGKLLKTGCREYRERFKNSTLRAWFQMMLPDNYSILSFLFGYAVFAGGDGAIPEGGSKAMSLRMEQRYKELGGKVICNSQAEEIIIENGIATGVRFADGSIVKADYVLAACDARITFDKLLKGKFSDKKFELRYGNPKDYPLPTSVQVALGVTEDLSNYPYTLIFPTDPFMVGTGRQDAVGITNYSYEPKFAPKGSSVLIATANQSGQDYEYWEKLYLNKEAYRKEKQRIAEEYRIRLERRFPELAGKINVLDVATPMTYHRYTGAYLGAWMAFMLTTKSKYMNHSGEIKGLKNCYLTGQWLTPPGGLPTAAITGKFTIQRIAKQEKLKILPLL